MKILFCSSGPYSGSGYGTQVYHLMKYFTSQNHQVGLIATDFGKFMPYRTTPYTFFEVVSLNRFNIEKEMTDLPDYPLYPIRDNDYGWDVIEQHYQHFNADALIFFRDPWKILEISAPVQIPDTTFIWVPIDHDPVSDTLLKCVRVMPHIVSMSDFGYNQLVRHGIKNTMIPHCIEPSPEIEHYRGLENLSRLKQLYRSIRPTPDSNELDDRLLTPSQQNSQLLEEIRGRYPIILISLTNNQFPSRKAIDANLQAVRLFVTNYPESKIVIHSNMSGFQNNRREGINMDYICKQLQFPPGMIYVPYNDRIVSRHQITELYLVADILLHCSAGEGFGVPIIEAQYYGTSVVTNYCTAMPELTYNGICVSQNQKLFVNNVNSYWYYPNIDDVSKALHQLVTRNKDLQNRMINDGSRFIRDYFNVDKIGQSWLRLIRQYANNSPKYITISASKKN